MRVSPLSNTHIRNAVILAIIVMLVDIGINAVGAGERNLAEVTNSILTVVLACLSTVFCWYYWSILDEQDQIKKIWGLLGVGLVLWSVAEVFWAGLLLTGNEAPYPSIADYFWLPGYLFFFLPFYLLYRSLQVKSSLMSIAMISVLAVAAIMVVTVYVIVPVLQDSSSTLTDKVLGVIYPIGDLLIVVGASFLALALIGGAFSWVWTLIAVGFLVQAFSDSVFTYADSMGLYFPNGSVNFLTILVDVSYIFSYLLVAIGIYIQIESTIRGVEEPLNIRYTSALEEQDPAYKNVKISLFTDADNNIISASPTLAYLLPSEKDSLQMIGTPINQAIGVEFERAQDIFHELIQRGFLANQTIDVFRADHQPLRAQISGVANFDEQRRYTGADIIVTVRIKTEIFDDGVGLDLLDSFSAGHGNGQQGQSLEDKVVSAFFAGKIRTLYVLVSRFGGLNVAKSMQRIFNAHAGRLAIAVRMDGPNLVFDGQSHDFKAYRELLKNTINYAIATTSLEIVRREIDKMESGMDSSLIEAGKELGLYGLTTNK